MFFFSVSSRRSGRAIVFCRRRRRHCLFGQAPQAENVPCELGLNRGEATDRTYIRTVGTISQSMIQMNGTFNGIVCAKCLRGIK